MVIFRDRLDAGEQLADRLDLEHIKNCNDPIVLGIPRGGIATGLPIARKYHLPLEPITLRKLPIPFNDQMGFGAVALDRQVILNDELIEQSVVDRSEIEGIVDEVYKEVLRRDHVYRGKKPFPDLEGRCVIIADDGLATGYTMLGAVKFAREKGAARVIAAVPVAHQESYEKVKRAADQIVCLHIDESFSFAVAFFYESFPDMTDSEVKELLEEVKTDTARKR